MAEYNSAFRWEKIIAFQELYLLLALVALLVVFSFLSPYFFTRTNLTNIFRQTSMAALAAVGVTLLAIVGEVDLSIGSLQAVVGVGILTAMNATGSLVVGLLLGLGLGFLVGSFNGFLVSKLKLNSLIVTLGMFFVLRGAVYLYTGQVSVPDLHRIGGFRTIGYGSLGPLPWPTVMVIGIFLIFTWILRYTPFGRRLYAIGGNLHAATVTGINISRHKWICFFLAGGLAALSAVILTSRLGSGQFDAGIGFEFQVYASVVLGGTSLSGGRGTLLGSLLGVLILGVASNGMGLYDISTYWQMILTGSIIIFAVHLDERRRSSSLRRARSQVMIE